MGKIERVTVERVFNIGNYQTVRFGMEVAVEIGNKQEEVTRVFKTSLEAVEVAFNQIAAKREEERKRAEFTNNIK